MELDPGDVLVSFTDGVTDAADPDGRELREAGVLRVLRDHPDAPAADLAGRILEAADRFTGDTAQADDRTVAVVRFTGAVEDRTFDESAAEPVFAAA